MITLVGLLFQHLGRLKNLNLSYCENLIEVPDLSGAVTLEKISLHGCKRLQNLLSSIVKLTSIRDLNMCETTIEQVPPSIQCLSHLKQVALFGCQRLKGLPDNFFKLKNLKWLNVCGCPNLEYLPEIVDGMEHLTVLEIGGTGIKELPSSIGNLSAIVRLDLWDNKMLKSLPPSIYNTPLRSLDLACCSELSTLPTFSSGFLYLRSLTLSYTGILEVPDWFFSLPSLRRLDLSGTRINRMPESIISSQLSNLYIRDCENLQSLPELPSSLERVDATGTSLEMVSTSSIISLLTPQGPVTEDLQLDNCFKLNTKNILTEFQFRAFCMAMRLTLKPQFQVDLYLSHLRDIYLTFIFEITMTFSRYSHCMIVGVILKSLCVIREMKFQTGSAIKTRDTP